LVVTLVGEVCVDVPGGGVGWVLVAGVLTVAGVLCVVAVVDVLEVAGVLCVVVVDCVLDDVELVCVAWHCVSASDLTVVAPWPRLWARRWLTRAGSWASVSSSWLTAELARAQEPALTASEIALSSPEIVLFCVCESRPRPPLLLPQAATNVAAIARITAKIARKPNPIWRLTLVRGSVAFV
jgi:hypothetical protein